MKTYFLFKKVLIHTFLFYLVLSMASSASACQCWSKVSSVKSNMHTFQTILEIYAVDWGGVYPADLKTLEKISKEQNYWIDFKNPYTSMSGHGLSFKSLKDWEATAEYKVLERKYLFGLRVRSNEYEKLKTVKGKQPGLVIYEYVSPSVYRLYGTNKNGLLIEDRGKRFYLTNE